jgi:hypothetical protein
MDIDDDPYEGDMLLKELVESVLAPYQELFSDEAMLAMRDYLIVFMTTHPAAEPLYARLKSRPDVQKSMLIEGMRAKNAASGAGAPGWSFTGKHPRKARG